MPTLIKNHTFYKTSEAAQLAGLSRSTLLRWIAKGIIDESSHRDRRGWRLFSQADIKKIEEVAHQVQ